MEALKIKSLIDKLNPKLVVLICHHNADPDAVCAAYSLSQLLIQLRPELSIEIAAADGTSRLAKLIVESLPIQFTENPHIEKADLIITLDTNTIQQLGKWSEVIKDIDTPIIMIDHHASHPETELIATMYVADENASSTCEIIYRFFMENRIQLSETIAKALFLGIAFDTRHFTIASSTTLKIVAQLVEVGVNPQEAMSFLHLPIEYPERKARLKAAQRAKLLRIHDWLIAFSEVGSYQASAARALVNLGVHMAVVVGQRGKMLQVSLRSSLDFHEKTGVHLGRDIAQPLGAYLQGMGGGHSTSAGANGKGDAKASLMKCERLLKQKLK